MTFAEPTIQFALTEIDFHNHLEYLQQKLQKAGDKQWHLPCRERFGWNLYQTRRDPKPKDINYDTNNDNSNKATVTYKFVKRTLCI